MKHEYFILDVFTKTPFKGNPLAVVFDEMGLSQENMQIIAREFNLSETVFISGSVKQNITREDYCYDIKIFTPSMELPFAGHPTIGTAILLYDLLKENGTKIDNLILNEKIGSVDDTFSNPSQNISAEFKLPKPPIKTNMTEAEVINKGLRIESGIKNSQPIYNAGNPFLIIEMDTSNQIDSIEVDKVDFGILDVWSIYCVSKLDKNHIYVRMICSDIGEDPATGSAAAALVGYLVDNGHCIASGETFFEITQGVKMGRESKIDLRIIMQENAFKEGYILGTAVKIASGNLCF